MAKTELRKTLAQYNGDTKNEKVLAAIDQLIALQPIEAPARQEKLMDGDWLLISAPSFPGGQPLEDGTIAYTLGRLAFNLFQPSSLKLVLEEVRQPVFPVNNGEQEQRTHDIVVKWRSIEAKYQQIKGIVRNLGVCKPIDDNLLEVKFTGGVLEPLPDTDIEIWKAIFKQCNQPQQRSWVDKLKLFLARLMFGIVPPQEMNEQTGKIFFTMKKSPLGKLSILYLDDDLRITKGERGTVLVCEKR
jgi:hypothetical protein